MLQGKAGGGQGAEERALTLCDSAHAGHLDSLPCAAA